MKSAMSEARWKQGVVTVKNRCKGSMLFWFLVIILLCFKTSYSVYAETEPTYEATEDTRGIDALVGTVNVDELNVRTGFGPDYEIVKINGKNTILHEGDRVAVMASGISVDGNTWYEVRWINDGMEYHGYVRGKYVTVSEEKAVPLPTPTVTPEPTRVPTPTKAPEPTKLPTPTTVPVPTQAPKAEGTGVLVSIGRAVGILALVLVLAALCYVLVTRRKREALLAETSEKIDNLKNLQLEKGPEDVSGNPISVMKRKHTPVPADDLKEPQVRKKEGYESEALILARRERAKAVNEEIIEETRFYHPDAGEESDRMKQISDNLKEKEFRKEEIDGLRPGDMVYHEYFGKGVVFDNSDVKVIEIRFGADVRFINKASCVAKKLMKKI